MAGNGSLFWPWLRDYHIFSQGVCLSMPSVTTLCLKDPQMGDDTIYPELLTVGVSRWNKIRRQLKDKKNSLLTIINYLMKHNDVTIIYTIYIYIYIYIYILRERERVIEKLSLLLRLRGRKLTYLAGVVFLSYSIFRRVRLLLERL